VTLIVPMWPPLPLEAPPSPASSKKASRVGGGAFEHWHHRNIGGTAKVGAAVVSEVGCGRRNDFFRRLGWLSGGKRDVGGDTTSFAGFRKRLYSYINEFGCCELEIAEGVIVSTPSTTHLTGLPHHGSPPQFSYPPKSAPLLQNVAHIPR